MKLLVYTDNHFCEKSSIVTKFGTTYTLRLENQLKSINWVEQLAWEKGCQYIICAGDFFDKPHLTDQELTAIKDINWAPCAHYFLVGNHESEENDLCFSSTKALEGNNRFIISEPNCLDEGDFELAFLPYIVESNKQPLNSYFPKTNKQRILISHNDLLGIQMGPVVSKTGFSTEEIEANCTFCINGHLHNGQPVTNKILNLGNLTGKDFGEDANRYSHKVAIIDTDTFAVEFIENPYAFNFYKIDINTESDLYKLTQVKTNAVVSVKCVDNCIEKAREIISTNSNILESRIILIKTFTQAENDTVDISDLTVDQCVKFAECCREKIENTPILEAELAEILK